MASHLGIRSWLREASLASVVMSTVRRRGEKRGALADWRTCVISKSTASRVSKDDVMCSTVQRASCDRDKYSPIAHTCESRDAPYMGFLDALRLRGCFVSVC